MLSIFAAMATAGAPGMAALSMVSIVLVPLGLPASTGVIILIALDPIIDPFLTLLNQYSNCALSAMISKHHKSS
jgi:proton glutamate symport protein